MPPSNFEDWYTLVHDFAGALVARYGLAEVATWDFEVSGRRCPMFRQPNNTLMNGKVWNELWGMSWPDDYMRLYNASVTAIKNVHPSLRVGGPATMQVWYLGNGAVSLSLTLLATLNLGAAHL